MSNLKHFSCIDNKLEGELPEFDSLIFLERFWCENNMLSGSIPPFSASLNFNSLRAGDNNFEGHLPQFASDKMELLWIEGNNLSGCFPDYACDINFNASFNSNMPWGGSEFWYCVGWEQFLAPCGVNEVINVNCECVPYSDTIICNTPTEDYDELMHFFVESGGENWSSALRGWKEGLEGKSCNPCSYQGMPWSGITCVDGRVTKLVVVTLGFDAPLIDLRLDKLEELYIHVDGLTGEIPNFQNLPMLKTLNLTRNQLEGQIPAFDAIPNIEVISLGDNNLTGEIPDLSHLEKLKELSVYQNNLEGCFADWMCDLEFWGGANFKLPYNGVIYSFCEGEDQIGAPCDNWTDTNLVSAINEDCECISEPCTDAHPDLESLKAFYLATNGDEWFNNEGWSQGKDNFSCNPCNWRSRPWYGLRCENNRVVCIDLDGFEDCNFTGTSGNNLQGSLPDIELTALESLILDNNNLEGDFPSISGMPKLKILWVAFNQLSGTFPELENNMFLEEIRCSQNNISGPLPDIDLLSNLRTFTAASNDFEGCYSESYCDLDLIDLENNALMPWSGEIVNYCSGEEEIGAPCNWDATASYFINDNCECVVLAELDDINNIKTHIYPNPSSDVINIVTDLQQLSVIVYDIQGKVLLHSEDKQIDVLGLESGVYFIEVDGIETLKFVKL